MNFTFSYAPYKRKSYCDGENIELETSTIRHVLVTCVLLTVKHARVSGPILCSVLVDRARSSMGLYLFVYGYLTTLSSAHITQRRIIVWLMNNVLERTWEESAVA